MTILARWLGTVLLIAVTQVSSTDQQDRVSSEEREALVALYNAAGGTTWVHHDGWLGPTGSECHWYGVVCGKEWKERLASGQSVQVLELPNNGLTGLVPRELGALKHLKRLILRGNAIKAPLPDGLLQRFDEGRLEIDPLSLIHDVEEVGFDFDNPSMLCSGFNARISADGAVHMERRLCREHSKQAPELYCEHRDGRTYDFDMLGRFLVRNGFFASAESTVEHRGSDMDEVTVIAKRGGRTLVRHYWGRPEPITEWGLAVMLEGIIARVQWNGLATAHACSPK